MAEPKTLGDFIEYQMELRRMSARQFAEFLGVNHRMINDYRQHGKNPDVGNPRQAFLLLLAEKTETNPLVVFALAFGLADALQRLKDLSPSAVARAQRIEELPDEMREIIDDIILKHSGKRDKQGDNS